MLSSTTESIIVTEQSQVAEARRRVAALTRTIGYNETEQGEAAIIATELATNLVKHATGGELLITTTVDGANATVTLMTADKGPGMKSVEESMRDGFSTAGSSGSGLGALERLSADLQIYSRRESGASWGRPPGTGAPTAGSVIASVLRHAVNVAGTQRKHLDLFGIAVPYPGEPVCGDAWKAVDDGNRFTIVLVDGLGHGVVAAAAANAALKEFERSWTRSPVGILEAIHGALRGTRGAVASVAMIDFEKRTVTTAGVGNIGAAIVSGSETKRLLSHNGTLGHQARRFQELVYPFPPGASLVMHSDGISTHWDLASYPGVVTRSSALACGLLYRDARRQRDDTTVVIVRELE